MRAIFRVLAGVVAICGVAQIDVVQINVVQIVAASDFAGWEALRVVPQEGSPERMIAADLEGSGRQQLIVVNTRQSRLDFYRWLSLDDRKPPYATDPDRPNELPLATDWSHTELPLEDLPADVVAEDLDGDVRRELLVLTGPTLKLTAYRHRGGKWERWKHWDLPTASLTGRGALVLVRKGTKGREALVSCEQGILVVALDEAGHVGWIRPRESTSRYDWKLLDVDGDGDDDMLEWTSKSHHTIRWYENDAEQLRPPQTLHDQPLEQWATTSLPGEPVDVLCLAAGRTGLVRHYRLAEGEASPLGRRSSLPIALGPQSPWCGVRLGKSSALAAIDPAEPRIRVYRLQDEQWSDEESYPTIGNVRALAAPAAKPGTLLLWVKDAGDLYETHWQQDRLTYPKPLSTGDAADRKVLALDTVGSTVWWAERVGADVVLHVWPAKSKQPEQTTFADVGAKTETVLWLGDKRLLVRQAYASGAKLVSLDDAGKVVVSEPSHLAKVNLAEFSLYEFAGAPRLGRLTDGVLQWLDAKLQPVEQVMLADGRKLASFITVAPSPAADEQALALELGGSFVHRLQFDESGIARTVSSEKVPGGTALRRDPALGLFLIDADQILRLSSGRSRELELLDTIDGRIGRPSGVKEATIHRVTSTDVDGDGRNDLVLCDDRRHQLSVLRRVERKFEPLISWQVFDDQHYPYGGDPGAATTSEPRVVLGFDADGDSHRDLALLSQDRLLIYLGRETRP